MRWERLFADLEAQLEAEQLRSREVEVAERTRIEVGRVRVADRWALAQGRTVTLRLSTGLACVGVIRTAGPDWTVLAERPGEETLVPLGAVVAVAGLGRSTRGSDEATGIQARLGLGHVLAGLARDRSGVRATLADGSVLAGTLDRVGADQVDLAEHPPGEYRRPGAVTSVWTVPFTSLVLLRRTT